MWILYAIAASIFWGIDYALAEKVIQKIGFSTLLTIEFFVGFLVMLGMSMVSGTIRNDLSEMFSGGHAFVFTSIIIVTFILSNVLIVLSIRSANATLAGLIEISYPLFIAIFSWVFFRENNLNWGTAVGGVLICVGVGIIFLMNKVG